MKWGVKMEQELSLYKDACLNMMKAAIALRSAYTQPNRTKPFAAELQLFFVSIQEAVQPLLAHERGKENESL